MSSSRKRQTRACGHRIAAFRAADLPPFEPQHAQPKGGVKPLGHLRGAVAGAVVGDDTSKWPGSCVCAASASRQRRSSSRRLWVAMRMLSWGAAALRPAALARRPLRHCSQRLADASAPRARRRARTRCSQIILRPCPGSAGPARRGGEPRAIASAQASSAGRRLAQSSTSGAARDSARARWIRPGRLASASMRWPLLVVVDPARGEVVGMQPAWRAGSPCRSRRGGQVGREAADLEQDSRGKERLAP